MEGASWERGTSGWDKGKQSTLWKGVSEFAFPMHDALPDSGLSPGAGVGGVQDTLPLEAGFWGGGLSGNVAQRPGAQERFAYLLCEFLLLFTCPRPVQPGVGHLRTFSCMART